MVFSTTALFKGIACPEGSRCSLTSCIFAHEFSTSKTDENSANATPTLLGTGSKASSGSSAEPANKRRRVTYESLDDKPPSRADRIRDALATARSGKVAVTPIGVDSPPSLEKPVSPPSLSKKETSARSLKPLTAPSKGNAPSKPPPKKEIEETLNPRLIPNDPAGYTKRATYLKYLHAEMARLNTDATKKPDCPLQVNGAMLIRFALDEEERIAREQPALYANVIKNRIAALRKFTPEDWIKWVQEKSPKDEAKPPKTSEKIIDSGLSPEEELCILPHLIADQKPLAAFGYVPSPPTPAQMSEAAAAVEASRNYEICDRCTARFQVFPTRNEDGQLTSAGPCQFHPNRKVFPPRAKTDRETGPKEAYFPCCHQPVGSLGCTTHPHHVFKTSDPARLAVTAPFVPTPENPHPAAGSDGRVPQAVAFDCEMGYTTHGMELIRLTATAWPSGQALLDVLVRPLGTVLDLNSRFSGVFPEHYRDAVPYDQWKAAAAKTTATSETTKSKPMPKTATAGEESTDGASTILPIVDGPARARALLCTFLTPQTPLLGHAIDNDLNTVRLCHPALVDTVLLFPHPRGGLPLRQGLRHLSMHYLGRAIQTGGARGHDSREDAVATGDLVRVKVGEVWRRLRREGWTFAEGPRLVPPPSSVTAVAADTAGRAEAEGTEGERGEKGGKGGDRTQAAATAADGTAMFRGRKRRKISGSDGAAESADEEELKADAKPT